MFLLNVKMLSWSPGLDKSGRIIKFMAGWVKEISRFMLAWPPIMRHENKRVPLCSAHASEITGGSYVIIVLIGLNFH